MTTIKLPRLLSSTLFNNNSIKAYFEPLVQMLYPHWKINYYRARVKEIIHENNSTYSIVLHVGKRFKNFKAGQFIELCLEINGTRVSRYFSISSPPYIHKNNKCIKITIQKQKNGAITPVLPEILNMDQYIHISKPQGNFHLNNTLDYAQKGLLFIAGGSGITPIKSMVDQAIYKNNDKKITVLYYAHQNDHLFEKEWSLLNTQYENISIHLIDSKIEGHFNQEHLNKYCPEFTNRNCYICGPNKMIYNVKNLLKKNIDPKNIHHEYFGPQQNDIEVSSEHSKLNFSQSNLSIDLLKGQNKTLLEVAESAGLKPQTGCRIGICHQCICQKQSGRVYNTLTQSYSDSGKQEIQLCVSVAIDDVTIDL